MWYRGRTRRPCISGSAPGIGCHDVRVTPAVGSPYPTARIGGADVGHLTGTPGGVDVADAYALPLPRDVSGSYQSCLAPRLDRHTCLDRRSRHPMDGAAARPPDMRSDHLQRLVHLPAHGYQEASRQTSFVPRGHLVMQRATRRVGYLLTGATARAPRRFPQERRP